MVKQLQQTSKLPTQPTTSTIQSIPAAPIQQSPIQHIYHTTYSTSQTTPPHQRTVQILPSYLINEHLQTAQSQNYFHHNHSPPIPLTSALAPPPPPPTPPRSPAQQQQQMKTLLDLINGVSGNRPSLRSRKRRIQNQRRQRLARNNYDESSGANYWADRTAVAKSSHNSLFSIDRNSIEPIGSANNNVAYAISLSANQNKSKSSSSSSSSKSNPNPSKTNNHHNNNLNLKSNSNSNRLNGIHIESLKNFNSQNHRPTIKAENVLEAPFATSTSAGQTKTIVISGIRTITTSTDRSAAVTAARAGVTLAAAVTPAATRNANKQMQNTKHRKEMLKQRMPIKVTENKTDLRHRQPQNVHTNSSSSSSLAHDHDHFKWQNKYNIDYDNKLEDEYEIIMKDE